MSTTTIREATQPNLDDVVHALADRTRRELLRLVSDRERGAGELAAEFPSISRPAVSQHLRILHEAGLVSVRADGRQRLFLARIESLTPVSTFIDEMWSHRLQRLKHVAEREERSTR